MRRKQLLGKFAIGIIIVLLVLLPAGTLALLAWKSLEEIKYKEDYYYERVGHDIAMNIISALEAPLFAPAFLLFDESHKGAALADEAAMQEMIASFERMDSFSSSFYWYPGPVFQTKSKPLISSASSQAGESEDVKATLELDDQIMSEFETYGEIPRGFCPRQYGSSIAAISKYSVRGDSFIIIFFLDGSGSALGILTYRINLKEFEKRARLLYSEPDFADPPHELEDDIAADLRAEIYFDLEPFNDTAVEATLDHQLDRQYVFISERKHSPCWGVRIYNAYPENTRINKRVVQSMFAILAALLAVILLGIFLLSYFVIREIELARLKSNFVSNVSHEIKTPLSLITLFTETLMLNRIKSEEEKHRFYEIIGNESLRLTHMINNILDFSRMEEGRRTFEFAAHPLDSLLAETLRTYQYQLDNSGCKLSVEVEENLPDAVVDPGSFTQAVLNLLDNALKYSMNEKFIVVSLARAGKFVRLDIADKGIGIPKSDIPHIFEKFYRVNNADVYNVKGSGLGLSVVKHIMDAHKGTIEMWSEPGKGSRFSLFFRIHTSNAAKVSN